MEAVKYGNSELQMPPKGKLSEQQIKDLESWINDGAAWPGPATAVETKAAFNLQERKSAHWAWRPVMRPVIPKANKTVDWPRDSVDQFILYELEAKGLAPAADADAATWLRRVTFALTGLPPSREELAAFLKAPSQREAVVDRLLASQAFGERWARHWLDLARYAETRGHEFDFEVPFLWRYRDYVVRALNDDVPYDRFIREQLAGDDARNARMKNGVNEALHGTAFWRLGEEVQSPVDIVLDEADRFDNRIDVFSKAVLGLTVSCARCHDHKFDAISQKDYYALFGLLQGGADTLTRIEPATNAKIAQQRAVVFDGVNEKHAPATLGPKGVDWPAKEVIFDASHPEFQALDYSLRTTPCGGWCLRKEQPRREERAAVVLDRFWEKLQPADKGHEFGKLGTLHRAHHTLRSHSFTLEKDAVWYLVRGGGQAFAAVRHHTTINGPLHGNLLMTFADADKFRWVKQSLKDYRGQRFHVELTADPKTDFAVAAIVQSDAPPALPAGAKFDDDEATLTAVKEALNAGFAKLDTPMWKAVVIPAVADQAAFDEKLFLRGNPKTLGEVVPHRGLEALDGPDALRGAGSGRFEWARRVTDPARNPFLARVIVNRVWHHLFGRGIVASCDNLGVLGERPTHPELLDHLAAEFMTIDMSLKRLIKRLVLSRTFALASTPRDSVAKEMTVDAGNELLHTFRLRRLDGESIRDAMLACSGRLDRTLGGPPVPIHLTPFMEGRGKPSKSGPLDGDGRRSLYLAVRRNFLSPFLLAFDTPIPFSSVGRRQVSNVPAQSLILLNDPFVHSQAKVWGERMQGAKGSIDERIRGMFETAFARVASTREIESCRVMVSADDVESWTALAHALFNVKEFVFVK
jgi:hypothetical protein